MLTNCPSPPPPPAGAVAAKEEPAQLAELLVRTARRLQRSSMAEFGSIGLTGSQARAVFYLERLGRPARMADIAAALEVVPRSATSVVDELERAGLASRAIDPSDRRSVLVSLTSTGSALLDRVAQARRRTAETTFGQLSAPERRELARLLTRACGPCCGGTGHGGRDGASPRRARGNGGN